MIRFAKKRFSVHTNLLILKIQTFKLYTPSSQHHDRISALILMEPVLNVCNWKDCKTYIYIF